MFTEKAKCLGYRYNNRVSGYSYYDPKHALGFGSVAMFVKSLQNN